MWQCLDSQLTLVIFDGLRLFIWVIHAGNAICILMTRQDHGCHLVRVVTPCVWRPVTLVPVLHCSSSKSPDHANVNHICVSCYLLWLMYQLLEKFAFLSFPEGPIALKSTRHSSVSRCFMISWSDAKPLSSTSMTTYDSALLSISPCFSLACSPVTLLYWELAKV